MNPLFVRPRRALLLGGLVAIVAFGAGWLLAGAGRTRLDKEELLPEAGAAGPDRSAVMVTAEPVTFRAVQRGIEAVGTLHGFEDVTLSAKVEGRIRKVHHDVADLVAPGELILEIDPVDNELAVRHAENSLQVELARLGLAKPPDRDVDLKKVPLVVQAAARLENLKSRLTRAEGLAASRAISEEDLAAIRADYGVADAEYANQILIAKAGLATIQMKQTALAIAQQQLKDTQVRAPTPTLPVPNSPAGVKYAVTQRSVAEGTLVRTGTEVCKLVINQTLKLRVPVPERHGTSVGLGQKVEVHTAAHARAFAGTVTRINPAVDPTTRTFEVEVQVPNPGAELKSGSFAKALILTRQDAGAATVPLSALVTFAGVNKLFLFENGKARAVEVALGVQTTEWVEITSPALARGTQVITSGQTVLADDTPVRQRAAPPGAPAGRQEPAR